MIKYKVFLPARGPFSGLLDSIKKLKLTPVNPRHNDFYIVEFPKSGITWLSALIANTALIESRREEVASFVSVHLYIPDIHITRHVSDIVYNKPPVRFIKSHSQYNNHYHYVLYLVRHPLAVMKSYFQFRRDMSEVRDKSLIDFCKDVDHGIPAWKKHVNSWLTGRTLAQRLYLIKYEDMIEAPERELLAFFDSFGWSIDPASVRRAVELSSKEYMKNNESVYRARNPRYDQVFVDGSGGIKVESDVIGYINRECRDELRLLGYN